eukprot:TRINITY_DN11462_c0_g1_i2.p2 TRINITY_DN11462_c0_g1~~TRINITY_DN11462_c0_g1_i2.p2  ORF type:complete len:114 (-),score=22.85 TRINITY_DN11462_c0_g1_i2:55-396(-)
MAAADGEPDAPAAGEEAAEAAAAEATPAASLGPGARPRAWLDIDINETRAAYQLAKDFVAARNLAYSLSSDRLEMLQGAEKRRVKDSSLVSLILLCLTWYSSYIATCRSGVVG